MAKRKHHFVPKFYLGAFQSAPRRINLYNLTAGRAVKDASIRNQCYRRKFYGRTDVIENRLAHLESITARVLRSIRTKQALPAEGTENYGALLAFVALQILRTTAIADRTNAHVDKMIKQAYSRDRRFANMNFEALEFGYEDPVLASLRVLPEVLQAIFDLCGHLVVAPTNAFVTSDNPACKYNQYCEGIRHMGVTGARSRGLQIFLPLAPDRHLILYDGTTYRLRSRFTRRSFATRADIDAINVMQLVSADENVYFADWLQAEDIDRLMPRVARYRESDPTVVEEYGRDDDPRRSLLHTFERMPCLKLGLSFMKVRRLARKIPLEDRGNQYRNEIPLPPVPKPHRPAGSTVVTYSRFIGRR